MADFKSSLPVRTEANGDVVVFLHDGVSQLSIAVDGSAVPSTGFLAMGTDGTNAQTLSTDTSGNLNVNIVSGAGGTTDTDDDSVAGGQTASLNISLLYGWNGTEHERVNTDGNGALETTLTTALPAGANSIGTVGLDAGSNNIGTIGTIVDLEATDGAAALSVGIQMLGTDGTNAQIISVDTDGAVNVIQKSGAVFDVNIVGSTDAENVHDYQTTAAVASDATTTHTYTVTAARTLLLKSVQASGSGRGKCEVQVNGVTEAVFFWSSSKQQEQIVFPTPIEVAATQDVDVILTNRDNQAQDMFSFVNGEEVA